MEACTRAGLWDEERVSRYERGRTPSLGVVTGVPLGNRLLQENVKRIEHI